MRERELPCRLKWDEDLFELRNRGDDRLLDVRTLDPDGPRSGPIGSPRNVLQRLLILSDLPTTPAIREELINQELASSFADETGHAPASAADTVLSLQRSDLLQRFWRRQP